MLEQLRHTGDATYTYGQRVLAGDISGEQFEDLINQLMQAPKPSSISCRTRPRQRSKASAASTPTGKG